MDPPDVANGQPVVIFFEAGADAGEGTAVAFDPSVDEQVLTFEMSDAGFRDVETGTTWDLAGRGLSGPLAGRRLEAIGSAYVSFWFAWRHFQPDSRTFQAS